YADGDTLFAHGHKRLQPDIGHAGPPGLWMLQRHCPPEEPATAREAGVAIVQEERVVLFIASVPLTDEAWQPLAEGDLVAVRQGALLATRGAVAVAGTPSATK
ncbi:MAG: class II glutamine amidotransferase, partial [Burkholderiaceae bacterium]|nr:class II glutamine amidotransferase [Burkholderiaceae bacterium]